MESKGTEDSPSSVANELAEECMYVPNSQGKLSRSLTMLAVRLEGSELQGIAVSLLEKLGGEGLDMVVAPVIVKGTAEPRFEDLQPIRERVYDLEPNMGRGMSISLGVNLSEFAELVTSQARASK